MEFSRAAFDALKSEGMTRAWDGIGGSHTLVTYPPLDALRPLSPLPVVPQLSGIRNVNLYVHVPFCEMSCAFCPYETQVLSDSDGSVGNYLRALTKEMDLIVNSLQQAEVQSLYIGGGTATVLSETVAVPPPIYRDCTSACCRQKCCLYISEEERRLSYRRRSSRLYSTN